MSLRKRLLLSHSLLVLVCLCIITGASALFIRGYLDRFSQSRINDVSRPIYIQVRALANTDTSFDALWYRLEEQAQTNHLFLLVLDKDGAIIKQATPANGIQSLDITPGEIPTRMASSMSGTFSAENGQSYVYSAYALGRLFASYTDISDARILVIAVPRSQMTQILSNMFRPLLFATLIALALSIILAVVMARSIYRPMQHLSKAVASISEGKYDHELPVTGPVEFKELATGFNNMVSEVRLAQERLRHFVADVSHQLKSPLTSIRGFAQAIIDGTAGDKEGTEKAAAIIQEESRKMMRQVDELLDLSRMQSGQTVLKQETVNITEILNECREIYSLLIEDKHLTLSIDPANVPEIPGDYDRLEQLFSNLLDNAIKNSPLEGKITVSFSETETMLEVHVSDTGPGIAPEQLPYVFERFYQAMGVRTGVGLGLAIVKEIVQAHSGNVEARSAPGEGAEFIVRLPKHR